MGTDKSERICAYCEYSTPLFHEDTSLCRFCGVVAKDHRCRRFSYDPLKRVPPKAAPAPKLDFVDIDSD
ncbi:MAG: hypothetical protein PUC29_02665 [Clostridia bacterium]|nr:hypothetical protein [Clostridia bacterium]